LGFRVGFRVKGVGFKAEGKEFRILGFWI